MRVEATPAAPAAEPADAVAVFAGSAAARALDRRLGGRLRRVTGSGELRDRPGACLVLQLDGELAAPRLALLGIDASAATTAEDVRAAGAALARALPAGGTVAVALDPRLPLVPALQAAALAEGLVLAGLDSGRWCAAPRDDRSPALLRLLGGAGEAEARAAADAVRVAAWVNRARVLTLAPPNLMTPAALLREAEALAEHGLAVETLDAEALARDGFGGILAVGGGSANPPGLAVIRHAPPGARRGVRLALLGKGVTFDSGGYFLKPSASIVTQKTDMAGAAAVIAALGAIAELGVPLEVLGLVPAAESALGGKALRPGDIVTLVDGTTVEVGNPDAEGRLLLAEAIAHARRLGATHVVDLATLTGAIVALFGDHYAGLFANDDALAVAVERASVASGDPVWRLPLEPRLAGLPDSELADLRNSPGGVRAVGLFSAQFLGRFAAGIPYAHLDIAGVARTEAQRGCLPPGPTGYGVRLLVELARAFARPGQGSRSRGTAAGQVGSSAAGRLARSKRPPGTAGKLE